MPKKHLAVHVKTNNDKNTHRHAHDSNHFQHQTRASAATSKPSKRRTRQSDNQRSQIPTPSLTGTLPSLPWAPTASPTPASPPMQCRHRRGDRRIWRELRQSSRESRLFLEETLGTVLLACCFSCPKLIAGAECFAYVGLGVIGTALLVVLAAAPGKSRAGTYLPPPPLGISVSTRRLPGLGAHAGVCWCRTLSPSPQHTAHSMSRCREPLCVSGFGFWGGLGRVAAAAVVHVRYLVLCLFFSRGYQLIFMYDVASCLFCRSRTRQRAPRRLHPPRMPVPDASHSQSRCRVLPGAYLTAPSALSSVNLMFVLPSGVSFRLMWLLRCVSGCAGYAELGRDCRRSPPPSTAQHSTSGRTAETQDRLQSHTRRADSPLPASATSGRAGHMRLYDPLSPGVARRGGGCFWVL